MAIITRDQLLRYATSTVLLQEAQAKRVASVRAEVLVFLSHSHHDSGLVEAAKNLLANQGARVYIDWQDGGLPANTSRITADALKSKIKECTKLVLVASQNALDSRWVPWELGCADGEKGIKHIAILPVAENDGSYRGNEYIQIYPRIDKQASGALLVVTPGETAGPTLGAWLRGR